MYREAKANMSIDAECIYMDGTFYSSPALFAQVYSVHVLVKNYKCQAMVCCAFFLLPSKQQQTYIKMLQLLQQKVAINCSVCSAVFTCSFDTAQHAFNTHTHCRTAHGLFA